MAEASPSDNIASKRKRSPSDSAPPPTAPAAKVSKTSSANQLSINYLSRHSQEDLPLLSKDDTLPNLLQLLTAYGNVLDRHESLASNLGARPLGPILIKRFERCFDAPPKVVASHHKGSSGAPEDAAHHITWLEVIEFARSHSSQFTLSTFSEGRRVCQFYYPQKQLRVQVNEDDFLFINSGRCQELIPPLPIWEDEEKEVGTCDVLDAKLKELTNVADMVAARTRQLSHRLKGRRAAILERRAEGGSGTPAKASAPQTTTAPPSSGSGFVAVNTTNGRPGGEAFGDTGSFAAVRSDLLRHFESLPHNQGHGKPHSRHHSTTAVPDSAQLLTKAVDNATSEAPNHGDRATSTASSLSPVPPSAFSHDILGYHISDETPAPNSAYPTTTPHRASISGGGHAHGSGHGASKHNFSRPLPPALESSQPFRPLCQSHMDSLPRGQRVLPPCDRCRRLRMDCVKNLTSCAGCTKKHARCHWRDVTREELSALDMLDDAAMLEAGYTAETGDVYRRPNGHTYDGSVAEDSDDDDSNPLEDLEALGEKEDQREKELADRMREDEEGLRNARELAKQGREGNLRAVEPDAAPPLPAVVSQGTVETVETAVGAESREFQGNAIPDVPQSTTTTGSNAQLAAKAPQMPEAAKSPAFVPLPPKQAEEAPDMRVHSGFHAVNGPVTNGVNPNTNGWSAS